MAEDSSIECIQTSASQLQPSPGSPRFEAQPEQATSKEEGTNQDQTDMLAPLEEQTYDWCKCFCEPAEHAGRDHYYLHFVTRDSRWEEPEEPYWLWDAATQSVSASGLQYPKAPQKNQGAPGTESDQPSTGSDQEYQGYNPKIHGSYDPNAPYAQYHKRKLEDKEATAEGSLAVSQPPDAEYATAGTFNRFTGSYQSEDKSADRHNDFNKSSRQLNSFFDVDAAANSHDGRSLKAERQQQKLSKKEIKELADKRRQKKEKKRMDFYRS